MLLAAAFPPLDLGPLALVALVPLLWVWRDAGPVRAALTGLLAGCVFFTIVLSWVWYFGAVAIVPLVLAQAAFWAATGGVVGALGRLRVRAPWVTAAAWTLLEWMRGRWPLGGLAWGEVGATLHDVSAARAIASAGGLVLVTFLVVAWNGLLVDALVALRRREHGLRPLALAAAGLGALLAVTLVLDAARFTPTPTGRMRFALLQGNDQNRRLTQAEIDAGFLTERHFALADRLHGRYDLIVFPESALESDPETDPALARRIRALARDHDAAVLVNVIADGPGDTEFNANRLYEPDGRLQGTYAKRHLVPFGEYVPWRDRLGFIRELQQVPRDFTPGRSSKVFDVHGHRVGSVICFESVFAPLVRESVRDGAEVVVVSTNNRSYRRSANSAQHLAVSQMRAAETGRPVLHASISGITGVIDASGRLRQRTALFRQAVVTGSVTTMTGETPYVRYGAWIVPVSWLILLSALLVGMRRRRLAAPRGEPVAVESSVPEHPTVSTPAVSDPR